MTPSFAEIAVIVTAISALVSAIASILNRGKIKQVHVSLNSRLSQLIEETRLAAHLAGKEEEREKQAEMEKKNGNGDHK